MYLLPGPLFLCALIDIFISFNVFLQILIVSKIIISQMPALVIRSNCNLDNWRYYTVVGHNVSVDCREHLHQAASVLQPMVGQ